VSGHFSRLIPPNRRRMSRGTQLRPGWFSIHRDAEEALTWLKPAVWGTLVRLVARANPITGIVRRTLRGLAEELHMHRTTLDRHLAELVEAVRVRVNPGPNQERVTEIEILDWEWLTGRRGAPGGPEVGPAGEGGGLPGGLPGGVEMGPPTLPPDPDRPAETRPKNVETQQDPGFDVSRDNPGGPETEPPRPQPEPPTPETKERWDRFLGRR